MTEITRKTWVAILITTVIVALVLWAGSAGPRLIGSINHGRYIGTTHLMVQGEDGPLYLQEIEEATFVGQLLAAEPVPWSTAAEWEIYEVDGRFRLINARSGGTLHAESSEGAAAVTPQTRDDVAGTPGEFWSLLPVEGDGFLIAGDAGFLIASPGESGWGAGGRYSVVATGYSPAGSAWHVDGLDVGEIGASPRAPRGADD